MQYSGIGVRNVFWGRLRKNPTQEKERNEKVDIVFGSQNSVWEVKEREGKGTRNNGKGKEGKRGEGGRKERREGREEEENTTVL